MGKINLIIDWQKYETKFMGETISMEIRPLKRWAVFKLAPLFDAIPAKKPKESNKKWFARLTDEQKESLTDISSKIQDISGEIFSDHVKNLNGIFVNDKPVSMEILSEEFAFTHLCVQICGQLMSITNLDKGEEKN